MVCYCYRSHCSVNSSHFTQIEHSMQRRWLKMFWAARSRNLAAANFAFLARIFTTRIKFSKKLKFREKGDCPTASLPRCYWLQQNVEKIRRILARSTCLAEHGGPNKILRIDVPHFGWSVLLSSVEHIAKIFLAMARPLKRRGARGNFPAISVSTGLVTTCCTTHWSILTGVMAITQWTKDLNYWLRNLYLAINLSRFSSSVRSRLVHRLVQFVRI